MKYVEEHNIFELLNTIVWKSFVNKEANPKRFVLEYLQKELGGAQQSQGSSSAATSDAKHQEQADPKKKRFKHEKKPAKAVNDTIDRTLHFFETTEVTKK